MFVRWFVFGAQKSSTFFSSISFLFVMTPSKVLHIPIIYWIHLRSYPLIILNNTLLHLHTQRNCWHRLTHIRRCWRTECTALGNWPQLSWFVSLSRGKSVSCDLSLQEHSIRSAKSYNFRSKGSLLSWPFYGWIVNIRYSKSIDSTCLTCIAVVKQSEQQRCPKPISIFFATSVYRRITNLVLSHLYIYIVYFYIALKQVWLLLLL